jgi:protein-tyrosine phosphatase
MDMDMIDDYSIGAILYIGHMCKDSDTLQQYVNRGVNHKFISMKDSMNEDINKCFNDAYEFMIKNKAVNILVHCRKGISRSPTIVAYYLMKLIHDYSCGNDEVLQEVLDLLCEYRPCVKPNRNFINQLKKHEHSMIYKKNTMVIQQR